LSRFRKLVKSPETVNVATVQLPVGDIVFVPGDAVKVTAFGALTITIPEPPAAAFAGAQAG
jgi:hypothetical protein